MATPKKRPLESFAYFLLKLIARASTKGTEKIDRRREREALRLAKQEAEMFAMQMKFTGIVVCDTCGALIASDASFCGKCGVKVREIRKCEVCGGVIPDAALFCGNCGVPVTPVAAIAPEIPVALQVPPIAQTPVTEQAPVTVQEPEATKVPVIFEEPADAELTIEESAESEKPSVVKTIAASGENINKFAKKQIKKVLHLADGLNEKVSEKLKNTGA
jgi:ribosomal protein L40E